MPGREEGKSYMTRSEMDLAMMRGLLHDLPGPKWDNLQSLAVRVALDKFGHNKSEAARYLGVSLRTMRNWINGRKS